MKKLLALALITFLLTGCTYFQTNKNQEAKTLDFEKETIIEESDTFKINVEKIKILPDPIINSQKVNIAIQAEYELIIGAFKESIQDLEIFNNVKHTLQIKSEPILYTPQIISIQLEIYTYTGGAHGNSYSTGINYDVQNDKSITIINLADSPNNMQNILDVFSQEAYEQILSTHTDIELDTEWVKEGTDANIINFQHILLTSDGIIIHIPSYQVAPYAVGPFTVIVPYEKIKMYLTNESLLKFVNSI